MHPAASDLGADPLGFDETATTEDARRGGSLLGAFCGGPNANELYREFARGFSEGFADARVRSVDWYRASLCVAVVVSILLLILWWHR